MTDDEDYEGIYVSLFDTREQAVTACESGRRFMGERAEFVGDDGASAWSYATRTWCVFAAKCGNINEQADALRDRARGLR